ncbi:MAG: mandelate racemase/muconate lactonizing enzyme family protein [Gammaproteobacteria bacterium]|nr:mandelate racemase/muconate lactonizing enzyme family protein [Gammaproteobacteria bacterium]
MKIERISVYSVAIPFKPLGSIWVDRRRPDHLDSTIVAIQADNGLIGFGESCPIGAVYLPAFAGGLRAGIDVMAGALIGENPTDIDAIYSVMDGVLTGHVHAKAAIDIACWDLFGKSTGLSISDLMGGRLLDLVPAYASIPLSDSAQMCKTLEDRRQDGFQRFQIKVGGNVREDIDRVNTLLADDDSDDVFMVDANRGWAKDDALRVVKALDHIDCYIEQPCASYRACLSIRRRARHPVILDEVIDSVTDLSRAIEDDALDGLVIKITHAGGLTPARLMRDICLAHGIKVRIEDTAGSEVTRAAQAQLAAATPENVQLGSYTFINDMAPVANNAPKLREGALHLNNDPGLGLDVDLTALGDPVAVYTRGDCV